MLYRPYFMNPPIPDTQFSVFFLFKNVDCVQWKFEISNQAFYFT